MAGIAIKVDDVSKTFKLPHEKQSSVKSALINLRRGKKSYEMQHALKDVSFEVKKGEFFGIVGRNGSGKSTLLKLLAGIYTPTKGNIHVNGRLTPFIELGVGFNQELTGRENVFLNGALLGFNRSEMQAMYKDIVEFAELEKFMDQKLKNYSSGMQVRLAFSIAIRAQSDILLIDEVLAVGDTAFQQKCLDYFNFLKAEGHTVIFISHDMEAIRRFCDRVVVIDKGNADTPKLPAQAIDKYLRIMSKEINKNNSFRSVENTKTRQGKLKIKEVWIENYVGEKTNKFTDKDNTYTIAMKFEALTPIDNPVPGVVVRNHTGERVTASNTAWRKYTVGKMLEGDQKIVKFTFPNLLEQGNYSISANVVAEDLETFYDWFYDALEISIERGFLTGGIVNPKYKVVINDKA